MLTTLPAVFDDSLQHLAVLPCRHPECRAREVDRQPAAVGNQGCARDDRRLVQRKEETTRCDLRAVAARRSGTWAVARS